MDAPRIISMEASASGRDDCYYRIQAGTNIKYITIKAGALDADAIMDMPLNFQNILPPMPYQKQDWNQAHVFRDAATAQLDRTLSQMELPGVQAIWHPKMFDFLGIERTEQLSLLALECVLKQRGAESDGLSERKHETMIAKIARFPWEVRYIEAETRMYQRLQGSGIVPIFLGHIQEAGRVIGFLLEKVDGRPACGQDLTVCEAALRRLHGFGIVHGDANRYNFVISPEGRATLIDFEAAKVGADQEAMDREVASLESRLNDESGIGGGFLSDED